MDVWKAYGASELTRLPPPSLDRTRPASPVVEARARAPERRVDAPGDAALRDRERAPTAGSLAASTSVEISKPADFLKRLSALQQSDATKFKHLLGELGGNLKAAANTPSGTIGAELGQLADRILLAAKTGDLSGLQQADFPAAPKPSTAARSALAAVATPGSTEASAAAALSLPMLGAAHAAMAAYRRNTPVVTSPSATVTQALDYVLAAVNEANR